MAPRQPAQPTRLHHQARTLSTTARASLAHTSCTRMWFQNVQPVPWGSGAPPA
jgi:hypothetical protein